MTGTGGAAGRPGRGVGGGGRRRTRHDGQRSSRSWGEGRHGCWGSRDGGLRPPVGAEGGGRVEGLKAGICCVMWAIELESNDQ